MTSIEYLLLPCKLKFIMELATMAQRRSIAVLFL